MTKLKKQKEDIGEDPISSIVQNRKIIKSDIPTKQIQDLIASTLDDNKAEEITIIDLVGKSDLAECMIIATGRSDRHIKACAEHLCTALKNANIHYAVEGMGHKNWVLVDTVAVIVHIFNKETRDDYNLEDLWK